MRKLLSILAVVAMLTGVVRAQTQNAVYPGLSNVAGTLYASNMGLWTIAGNGQTTGSLSWPSQAVCKPTSGGITFTPFTVGSPIRIVDTVPAHSETVTVTSVALGNFGCQVQTSATTFTHYTYSVTSSTGGLQEAINWAAGANYMIYVTSDFARLGGTTSTITSAKGNASVSILDLRNACPVAYGWTGSAYTGINLCSGGGSTTLTLTTEGTSGDSTLTGSPSAGYTLNIPDYSAGSGGCTAIGAAGTLQASDGAGGCESVPANYGITTADWFTLMAPLAIDAPSLPSQIAMTYDSHALTPGSSTTAVYGVDASGNGILSDAGAAAAIICTAGNAGSTSGCQGAGGSCGSVSGDATSTDCGFQNQTVNTGTDIQTFGTENVQNNSANAIAIIGDDNVQASGGGSFSGTGIGALGTANLTLASGKSSNLSSVYMIGNSNGTDLTSGSSVFCAGTAACAFPGSTTAALTAVIGIGPGAISNSASGDIAVEEIVGIGDGAVGNIPTGVVDIVGIGDGAVGNLGAGSSEVVGIGTGAAGNNSGVVTNEVALGTGAGGRQGTVNGVIAIGTNAAICNTADEIIGIGDKTVGGGYKAANCSLGNNSGTENIGIGDHALAGNETGTNNVAVGNLAGANGFVSGTSVGNANVSGSDNTWIGVGSGPDTTSQLSNTIALGFGAVNTASNQTVIGNSSITSLILFGCPSDQVAFDDGSGTCFTPLGGAASVGNVALGAGAGSGATITTVVGLDASHQIAILTGTTPSAVSTILTFTFTDSRGHTPYCIAQPAQYSTITGFTQLPNAASFSPTGYQLVSGTAALTAATGYVFNVSCP